MQVVVIKEHISEYPNAIYLNKGDIVSLGESDDEFPNWTFVSTESGAKGWTPNQYIKKAASGGYGTITHNYDSMELNTTVGEKLTVLFELNGWYRVSSAENNIGWVPVETVRRT